MTGDDPWPAVTWPGTQTRRLRAASNGASYRVDVWIPEVTPPPSGFALVVVLDGQAMFGTFVEAIRRSSRRPDATGIGPAAVVAIAHDDALYDADRRRLDYTEGPAGIEGTGGADAFLAFLLDELAPSLQAEWPLDARRRVLFGHSMAGYFALLALGARPGAFDVVAAISPSIWWDERALRARLADLHGARRVFIAVGEWEDELPPWQAEAKDRDDVVARRRERAMIERAASLGTTLASLLGAGRVAFHRFPEEDHASVLMIAIQRVLRFALAPRSND